MIIFASGDQHWAEFMAKEMPSSLDFGPAQTLYEVTASGVPVPHGHGHDWFLDWTNRENFLNSNREKKRKANFYGIGPYIYECLTDCVHGEYPGQKPWCYINPRGLLKTWGECKEEENFQVKTNQTRWTAMVSSSYTAAKSRRLGAH